MRRLFSYCGWTVATTITGMAGVSPQDAQSNLGAWIELFGFDEYSHLIPPQANKYIFSIFFTISVVSLLIFLGRRMVPRSLSQNQVNEEHSLVIPKMEGIKMWVGVVVLLSLPKFVVDLLPASIYVFTILYPLLGFSFVIHPFHRLVWTRERLSFGEMLSFALGLMMIAMPFMLRD